MAKRAPRQPRRQDGPSTWEAFESVAGFRPDRARLTIPRSEDPDLQEFWDGRARELESLFGGMCHHSVKRRFELLENTRRQLIRLGFYPEDRQEMIARIAHILRIA